MTWTELAQNLGLFAIGVAAIGWLSKTIVVHFLSKGIEEHKLKLQSENDVELEKLRSDLRLRSVEHEVRFRSIHERQAKVIAKVYSQLCAVQKNLASYVAIMEFSGEPTKQEKQKLFAGTYNDLINYFIPRKLFLPKTTGDQVLQLCEKMKNIFYEFADGQRDDQYRGSSPVVNHGDMSYWTKVHRDVHNELPALLQQVEHDFRELLGAMNTGGNTAKEQVLHAQ